MKKRIFNNEMGAVMIQAIAVVAAVSAISVLVMNTIDELSDNSRNSGLELSKTRAAYQLAKVLGSSAACMYSFNGSPTGISLPNSSAKIEMGPNIRDENNVVRYRNCETAGNCNLATSRQSYIAGGELRLAKTELTNFNSGTNKATMIFSFYDKSEPTPTANTRKKVVRLEVNAYVDGANNLINCNFGADNPLERICDIFGGTLEGDNSTTPSQEFCKSLFFEKLSSDSNDDMAYKVRGDIQITRDLNVGGALVVGSTGGNINNPGGGRLSADGAVDVAGTTSALSTFNIGYPASTNSSGVGQFSHSVWVTGGDSRSGSGVGSGDLGIADNGQLRVIERIRLLNFANNTDMSSAARQKQAVTVGWVKRQIAEAITTGSTELNDVWSEIATVAYGNNSDAENILRREFCESITVRNRYADGTFADRNTNTGSCLARLDRMLNNCNVNGNCSTVYANRMCLGGMGGNCYNVKPRWRYTGNCVNTTNQNVTGSYPYVRRLCPPNDAHKIYNPSNGRCCDIRLRE